MVKNKAHSNHFIRELALIMEEDDFSSMPRYTFDACDIRTLPMSTQILKYLYKNVYLQDL